jgi:dTDP-4-dehydrorhamnose 3,5-epimerase
MQANLPGRCSLRKLTRLDDERGSFLKVLMEEHVPEPARFGEIYLTSALPGGVKGQHYHQRTSEWFTVTRGHFTLWLQDLDTAPGPVYAIELSESDPSCVFVPPRIAHAFENRSGEVSVVLAYADSAYDPTDPDTFPVTNLPPPGTY